MFAAFLLYTLMCRTTAGAKGCAYYFHIFALHRVEDTRDRGTILLEEFLHK